VKGNLQKSLLLFFALVMTAGHWACGTKPLPRATPRERVSERKRPLYPLSADTISRVKIETPTSPAEPPLARREPLPLPRRSGNIIASLDRIPVRSLPQKNVTPTTGELTFQQNARGEREAVYRLKKGEALYSAVVVRFTGRIEADEVNAIAKKILDYNGIRDETKIAAGTRIRIPASVLDEEVALDKTPPAIEKISPTPRVQRFRRSELQVILDAGHGGNDPGTIVRGWAEDEIAYDLMLRIKLGLQARGIKVYSTVRDKKTGDQVNNGSLLTNNREEYVKVTPEYYMEDSRIALNLRIYLIEDLYRWMLRQGISPENIILLSIHLDHLHASVSGAMIYFPGAAERTAQYQASGNIYRYYKESKFGAITFRRSEMADAEDVSRLFALDLIDSFRGANIPIHDYKPIRRYVYRQDSKWTPGIIRYSRVPISILLEASNLSNRDDLWRIRSANFRQRLADAVVETIVAQK